MLIIIAIALGIGLGLGLKKDVDSSAQVNEGFFKTAAVATDAEPCSKV